jgi:hypothetical protein
MSYDYWDAMQEEGLNNMYNELGPQWAEDHANELFEKYYDEAIAQFTSERLSSYYIANPNLAAQAYTALVYAKSLLSSHPRAALVFAATAIEVTIKTVLLRPIVYGLVHNESVADFITELTTQHTRGIDTFRRLLTGILSQFGGIDFTTFMRSGSAMSLFEEIKAIENARHAIVHRGETTRDGIAVLAIVASTLLDDIFPTLLKKLGLHLHEPMIVCDKYHKSDLSTLTTS